MFNFLLVFILLIAGVNFASPNLDSLLVQSIGGQTALDSLKHITSFRAEGNVNLNGQSGRFYELFASPDYFYLKISLGNIVLVQAYDGHNAWQKDHNGRVSELVGYEKKALLSNIFFESSSYLLPDRIEGGSKYLGQKEYDGQKFHEIAFYPLYQDTVRVLIDMESGLRRYMFDKLDNMESISELGDYHSVGGVLVPYYSHTSFKNVPLFTSLETERIELNIHIDSSMFAMPTDLVNDYRFNDSVASITIPFEYRLGHIWLKATINGVKKVWFIIDSGSSANIFHTSAIANLNLHKEGSLPVAGITGYEEVDLVRPDSISIGSLTLLNQIAGSMDLSMFDGSLNDNQEFGGILGHDFLSRFPVMVNYSESTLTVFNPDGFEPPQGGDVVDFQLTMLIPTISGELNGIKGEFMVDLGNAYGLVLHRSFVDRYHLEEKLDDINDNPSGLGGVGGRIDGKTAYADSFRFGNTILQSPRVVLPDRGQGISGSEHFAGNIGNMILENFCVLFDYNTNRLIFYDSSVESE
ncbi:MAG: retroviral-like aspartic protease family protein [candidate division Zixibacteria bacterium]|nr:retroviral-like aspartic protease family protein [candidate division Zixibacteria bacterium]